MLGGLIMGGLDAMAKSSFVQLAGLQIAQGGQGKGLGEK